MVASVPQGPVAPKEQRRELLLLLVPIALLSAAGLTGTALTPALAPDHPLALLILDGRGRTLVLVAQHIGFTTFLVVAVLRRLASDPLSYLLGRRHGERAVRWIEERSGGGGAIRRTESIFRRASWLMVFLWPGLLVCALAGQTGMQPLVFAALNIGGTVALVITLRAFGTTVLAEPVDAVLRFFGRNRGPATLVSVSLVLAWLLVQRLRTRRAPSIADLEVEEGVEADGDAGVGGDRLDGEEDAGHEG